MTFARFVSIGALLHLCIALQACSTTLPLLSDEECARLLNQAAVEPAVPDTTSLVPIGLRRTSAYSMNLLLVAQGPKRQVERSSTALANYVRAEPHETLDVVGPDGRRVVFERPELGHHWAGVYFSHRESIDEETDRVLYEIPCETRRAIVRGKYQLRFSVPFDRFVHLMQTEFEVQVIASETVHHFNVE